MKTHRTTVAGPKGRAAARPARTPALTLLERYECGPVAFCGTPDASYERHLTFDHVVRPEKSNPRQRFEAVAWALRDLLTQRRLRTDEAYDRANPKEVLERSHDPGVCPRHPGRQALLGEPTVPASSPERQRVR